MMSVLLIVMLSGVSGDSLSCVASKSVTCHGVQGESLYVQLMPAAIGHMLVFKKITQKGVTGIFRYKKNQTIFYSESTNSSIMQRLDFTAMNGTVILNPATKEDSGTYGIEIINDDNGENVGSFTIKIIIQGGHSTDNDNLKTEGNHVISVTSASLGVVLLCVAVGVLYAYQRRTHTDKPADPIELECTNVSVLREQVGGPEQKNCEEEIENLGANLPAVTVESLTAQLKDATHILQFDMDNES